MSFWNEEYYDLLEFFYWEPQHLGRRKNPNSQFTDWNKVNIHLQKMEVLLNYHFALFFNLISYQNKAKVLSKLFKEPISDSLEISSNVTRNFEESINHFTQPDLMFEGKNTMVYVEMKLDSKSNCEQILKYLVLHILYEEKNKVSKKPYLLLLGKKDLQDFFVGKIQNLSHISTELSKYEVSEKLKRKLDMSYYYPKAMDLLNRIKISYANYDLVHQILKELLLDIQTETEKKLFLGMIDELEKRKLNFQ